MAWDDPLDFKKEGIVLDYKTAGVDIDAGNKFVEDLKNKVPALGGFGGMIKVPVGYEEPILVSGADGVGTKLNIEGGKEDNTEKSNYTHLGLAQRSFQRSWTITDDTEVKSVEFEDGLLTVTVSKIVPEHYARKDWL